MKTAKMMVAKESLTSEKAKDAFFQAIAEQLSIWMRAMLQLNDAVLTSGSGPAQRLQLERIADATMVLFGAMCDLLELARLASGEIKLDSAPFNPRELLVKRLAPLQEAAQRKGLRFELDLLADFPTTVIGDAERFYKLVTAAVLNAVRSSVHPWFMVRVEARDVARTEIQIEISIRHLRFPYKPGATEMDPAMQLRQAAAELEAAFVSHLAWLMGGRFYSEDDFDLGTVQFLLLPFLSAANGESGSHLNSI